MIALALTLSGIIVKLLTDRQIGTVERSAGDEEFITWYKTDLVDNSSDGIRGY